MTPLEKIHGIVKKLRKEHPKMSFRDAQKKAGIIYRSGSKPKAVAGVKKPKKRTVTRTERVTSIGSVKKAPVKSMVQRGESILRQIDSLTEKMKAARGVDAKNFFKRAINAEHDRLDSLTKKRKAS